MLHYNASVCEKESTPPEKRALGSISLKQRPNQVVNNTFYCCFPGHMTLNKDSCFTDTGMTTSSAQRWHNSGSWPQTRPPAVLYSALSRIKLVVEQPFERMHEWQIHEHDYRFLWRLLL